METSAEYVLAFCDGGYTTNLPLADLTGGRAWIAYEYGGEPLEPEHGGPARLLVPHLYFWKSAKWVRGLELRDRGRARLLGVLRLPQLRRPVERAALPRRLSWQLATVVELVEETARTKSIALELDGWSGHRAGQHVDVRLTAEDGYQAQRSYSIASAPEDAALVLTVERLDDGEVSPYLVDELRPGDQLELRGPIGGYFVWEASLGGPLLLVAGGSGIVPFRSILRHHQAIESTVPVRLLYSARTLDGGHLPRGADGTGADGEIDIRFTLTREQPGGWRGYTRRIDQRAPRRGRLAAGRAAACVRRAARPRSWRRRRAPSSRSATNPLGSAPNASGPQEPSRMAVLDYRGARGRLRRPARCRGTRASEMSRRRRPTLLAAICGSPVATIAQEPLAATGVMENAAPATTERRARDLGRASPFSGSTPWTRRLDTPLRMFLRTETGSAAMLLLATAAALVWANVDAASYEGVWRTRLALAIGPAAVSHDLHYWLSSGLMTLFFFVVGLEARREFDLGELRERRRLLLPLLAGLGGIVVPVAIFLAVNAGHTSAHGWGVAMSTDTAFALGVLALVRPRFPVQVRAFMLTVTVVDDLVALLVIATVYPSGLHPFALGLAARPLSPLRCSCGTRTGDGVFCVPLAVAAWLLLLEVRGRPDRHRAGDRPGHRRCSGRARKSRAGLPALPSLPRAANAGARPVGPGRADLGAFPERAPAAAPPPLDELRDRAPVCACERRHRHRRPLPRAGRSHRRSCSGSSSATSPASRSASSPPPGSRRDSTARAGAADRMAGTRRRRLNRGHRFHCLVADRGLAFHGEQLGRGEVGVLSAALGASLLAWIVFRATEHLPDRARYGRCSGRGKRLSTSPCRWTRIETTCAAPRTPRSRWSSTGTSSAPTAARPNP